jgi:hypothetical protein
LQKAILKELDKLRGQEEALDNAAQDRGEEQDVHMKVATQKLQVSCKLLLRVLLRWVCVCV